MRKIKFAKKAVVQAAVLGAVAILALFYMISQRTGLGQSYQRVMLNGRLVGYTARRIDVGDILRQTRREMFLDSGDRLCMDYEWETENTRKPFVRLLSEGELKSALREILGETGIRTQERVYTVAIDGYRANFSDLKDVETFLEKVKAGLDTENRYRVDIDRSDSNINGILRAVLTERHPKNMEETIQHEAAGGGPFAGISAAVADVLGYKGETPKEKANTKEMADTEGYQTGVLDMEFVEIIEIYGNYVEESELAAIDEAVVEVTKEKESNKIYEVKGGDSLSVIAMDHDTTVASIVALNQLKDANAIKQGQELIIAVPEPDLKIRMTVGEVYEEDYTQEPVIRENNTWYTTREVVLQEGTTGHRERNDVVVYENGVEVTREMVQQNIIEESLPSIVERGTIVPPTYIKPLNGGRFTSGYGRRWGRLHKGTDWACPVGTTVYASCGGTVIQASYSGGYGNSVVISHPDGRMTRYAHNSQILVKVGQKVEQGEPIAKSGNTGRSTGPHVHFELYVGGAAVDSLKYISY